MAEKITQYGITAKAESKVRYFQMNKFIQTVFKRVFIDRYKEIAKRVSKTLVRSADRDRYVNKIVHILKKDTTMISPENPVTPKDLVITIGSYYIDPESKEMMSELDSHKDIKSYPILKNVLQRTMIEMTNSDLKYSQFIVNCVWDFRDAAFYPPDIKDDDTFSWNEIALKIKKETPTLFYAAVAMVRNKSDIVQQYFNEFYEATTGELQQFLQDMTSRTSADTYKKKFRTLGDKDYYEVLDYLDLEEGEDFPEWAEGIDEEQYEKERQEEEERQMEEECKKEEECYFDAVEESNTEVTDLDDEGTSRRHHYGRKPQ